MFSVEVEKIFEIFGDDIRLVGGCVRDMLLEKEVNDYDFACVFSPDTVQDILMKHNVKSIPTGKKFGTITAVINGKNFEITTLRQDIEADGRHAIVEFSSDFSQDAKRRDFTMNALYMDSTGKVYDYFGGIDDLKSRCVKFIGNANERIQEDYLRVLRFFRFSLKYADKIDQEGLTAVIANKDGLSQLSRERIRQEYVKILDSDNLDYLTHIIEILVENDIDISLFSSRHNLNSITHLFAISKEFSYTASLRLRIACLFLHSAFDVNVINQEICATRAEKKYFMSLLQNQPSTLDDVKIMLAYHDKDFVREAAIFSYLSSNIAKEQLLQAWQFIADIVLSDFPVNNKDLIEKGFQGVEIGNKLQLLKDKWALSDYSLSRSELLDIVN